MLEHRHLGASHYLWPGGPEEKVGGGYKNFLMDREWARKKIEKARVGIEIFLPRKFSPLMRHCFEVFNTLQTTFKQV